MNENLSLYELSNAFLKIKDVIDTENEDDFLAYLDSIEMQISDKINNVIGFNRTTELTITAIKSEEERLKELRGVYERRSSRLKKSLEMYLKATDKKKIETPLAILSLRKSTSVVIDKESDVPSQFKIIKTEERVDKLSLKEHLKNNEESFAHLEEKENLVIK